MNQVSTIRSGYRAEIDGLRAFAVLSVVVFHAFPNCLEGGFVGVDVFFVISGFLITSHIIEELEKEQFSFIAFFGRRIRRIFPALVLVMASSLIFGWFSLLEDEYAQLGKHIASGATFLINFILVDESNYFDNASETKPMLHLWSLAVEEQFYIFWPLVLWAACKLRLNLLSVTVLLAAISFYFNLHFVQSHPIKSFFLPVGRLWEFLSGSILSWLLLNKPESLSKVKIFIDKLLVNFSYHKKSSVNGAITSNLLSFSGLSLLTFSIFFIDKSLPFPSNWALIPVVGVVLVISSGSKAWLNRMLLMNPIAVWFGLISYPLYLWHWPILSFLQIVENGLPHRDSRILAVLISILLAWGTYHFIERYFRLDDKKRTNSYILIVLIAVVGFIGLLIKYNGGVTPYNYLYGYIAQAKGDWAYPKGLVRDELNRVFNTSQNPVQVIFLGDSHIEQYGPRVVNQYAASISKEVSFITSGGCPPIPNVDKDDRKVCFGLLDRFKNVLSQNNVETVVIGAAFNGYLGKQHNKESKYFFIEDDLIVPLYTEDGLKLATESFYEFVSTLSAKYQVVVLLDIPVDKKFNPNTLLDSNSGRRPIPLEINNNSFYFTQADYQIQLANKMKERLSKLNVVVVEQAELICPNSLCRAVNEKGMPIYKDNGHMRPFFVIERMDVLDSYVLLPKYR